MAVDPAPPDELLDQRSDPGARSVLEDWEATQGWRTTRLGAALLILDDFIDEYDVDAVTAAGDAEEDAECFAFDPSAAVAAVAISFDAEADDAATADDCAESTIVATAPAADYAAYRAAAIDMGRFDVGADAYEAYAAAAAAYATYNEGSGALGYFDPDTLNALNAAVRIHALAVMDGASGAAVRGLNRWMNGANDMRDGLKILKLPGGGRGFSVTRIGWLRRVAGDEWELLPGARTIWRTSNALTSLDRLASHGPGEDHRLTDPQVGTEEIHRLVIRRALPANVEVWEPYCPRPQGWSDT